METRNILAKVCPKCSGTTWYWTGSRFYCKACRDAYFEKHREELRQWGRDHYAANKEQYKKKNKEWVKANPDKIRLKAKRWRFKHPDKVAAQGRRRRKRQVEQLKLRYVKERIKDGDPDIDINSITDEQINKYREYLKTKRLWLKIKKEQPLQDLTV